MRILPLFSLPFLISGLAASVIDSADDDSPVLLAHEQTENFQLACKNHNQQGIADLLPVVNRAAAFDLIVDCMKKNIGYQYKPIMLKLICTQTLLLTQFSGKSNEERNTVLSENTKFIVGPGQIAELDFLDLLMNEDWSGLTVFIHEHPKCLFQQPGLKVNILRLALLETQLNPIFFARRLAYQAHLFMVPEVQNQDVQLIMAAFLTNEEIGPIDKVKVLERMRAVGSEKKNVMDYLQRSIETSISQPEIDHLVGDRDRFLLPSQDGGILSFLGSNLLTIWFSILPQV